MRRGSQAGRKKNLNAAGREENTELFQNPLAWMTGEKRHIASVSKRLYVQDDVAVKVPHALAEDHKNDQDDQDDEDEEKRVLHQSLTFIVHSCEQGSPPFGS